jgi:hypothetical protein
MIAVDWGRVGTLSDRDHGAVTRSWSLDRDGVPRDLGKCSAAVPRSQRTCGTDVRELPDDAKAPRSGKRDSAAQPTKDLGNLTTPHVADFPRSRTAPGAVTAIGEPNRSYTTF